MYDIEWAPGFTYRDVRFCDELQFSVYNFEMADVATLWKLFDLHEGEGRGCWRRTIEVADKRRFPLLAAYDQVLKCSHLFNLLDARGAISVTERVGVIGRVRKLAVGVAQPGSSSRVAGQQSGGGRDEPSLPARNRHRRNPRLDDSGRAGKLARFCFEKLDESGRNR